MIELMIAMVLGLVLMAGVIEVFISSKQMYRVQDARARLQENGRFSVQFLANKIRSAGYHGCSTRSAAIPVTNTLNNSGDYLWNFSVGIQGVEATGTNIWTPAIDASVTQPLSGNDVLTLRGVADSATRVTAHPGGSPPGSADIQVNTGNGLEAGDIVMVNDCLTAAIFQITAGNPNTSGSIPHNTGAGTPGNATQALGKDYTGAEIVKLVTTSYYIRNNPNGIPSLYQRVSDGNAYEIVQGVEGMQLLYGVDTNSDEAIDQYLAANSVTDWDDIKSVRVSLLLRTIEDNLTTDGAQQYTFNNATVTPSDRRLRAIYSQTITLRNRVP